MVKHFAVDVFPTLKGEFVVVDIDMVFGADVCSSLPFLSNTTWGPSAQPAPRTPNAHAVRCAIHRASPSMNTPVLASPAVPY